MNTELNEIHRITLLGAGSFGIALAKTLAENNRQVTLWARRKEVAEHINLHHRHPTALTDIELPSSVKATSDLNRALENASMIISVLPMLALRNVWQLAKPFVNQKCLIVSTTKGVEENTHFFSKDLLVEVLGATYENQMVFLSGPSFATEVARGLPTALVLAGKDMNYAEEARKAISSNSMQVYLSTDVTGLEVAGAFKNVIAIAAGIAEGLQLGMNAKAALITHGLTELRDLAQAMGGQPQTLNGLAGVGDLMLTCYGNLSRNRRVGLWLSEGKSLSEILSLSGQIAEGVHSAKSLPSFCERYSVSMPIASGVYKIIFEGADPKSLLHHLL